MVIAELLATFRLGQGQIEIRKSRMVFEMDFLFRNSLKSREIKNDKNLIQMYQKHCHMTNLKSAFRDVSIKGWDKWSLMGHPVTPSSPYCSDYMIKKCRLIITVRLSQLLSQSVEHWIKTPYRQPPYAQQSIWVMGRTVLSVVALEQTIVCFCIDKMTLNFAVKTIQLNVKIWH